MATEITSKKRIPPAIFGALALLLALWLMDFPKPMVDDLFYTGAGMNLAQGGDLSNPMLARQEFPSHYFFVYPPLHSYLLAGWLKVGGINALSMTAFPLLMYLITIVATIAILRRHGAAVWLEWLVPLGVTTSLLAFWFANVGMLVMIWGSLGGKIRSNRGPEAGVALDARSTAEHPVLVDHAVARYIFDYRIPAGMLDIQFAAPFPKSHIVGQMRAGDIYLVGPENVEVLKDATLLDLGLAEWIPFALPNRHFYRYPCQVYVIPMENCHGLRAKYVTP